MKVGNLEEVLTFGAFKELTAANADMFRKEVHAAVNGHKVIEVDLSQTTFMDCSGLGALIALRNFARGRNGVMRLGESHPRCAATVRCRARRTHVRNRQHPADRPSPGSRATPPFNRPKRTQRWLDIKRELLSSHRLDRPHVTENRTEVHEFSRLVLCLVNLFPHDAITQPDCSRNSHAERKAAPAKFDERGLPLLTGGFPRRTCQRRISDGPVPTRCRSAHESLHAHWHSTS